MTWTGLGLMAVQFGALARLTWWEYSWDIMVRTSPSFPLKFPPEKNWQSRDLTGTNHLLRDVRHVHGRLRLLRAHQTGWYLSTRNRPTIHQLISIICKCGRQEYILADVRDRQFLQTFHKRARKAGMDVERYNRLKDDVARIQDDLDRLRDPLKVKALTPSQDGGQAPPTPGFLSRALQHLKAKTNWTAHHAAPVPAEFNLNFNLIKLKQLCTLSPPLSLFLISSLICIFRHW